jgi:hypothetical protein
VLATGDEGDVVAGTRQQGAEVPAHGAGTDHCDAHYRCVQYQ